MITVNDTSTDTTKLYMNYLSAFIAGAQGACIKPESDSTPQRLWATAFGYGDGIRARGVIKKDDGSETGWMPEDFSRFSKLLKEAMAGIGDG